MTTTNNNQTNNPDRPTVIDWDKYYQENDVENMPWFADHFDHDFDNTLSTLQLKNLTALDLGTGPGTQAIHLAKKGFRVTAVDISQAAIDSATLRAQQEGVEIHFEQDDVKESHITGSFEIIIDRGCFHSLRPEHRPLYAKMINDRLTDTGSLLLKCFSTKEPGTQGPNRLSEEMIREVFSPFLKDISIDDSEFRSKRATNPKALYCVMRK
ncbi:MAG: class I SAM-dependent methyltransferase [bacterium]|nr:class I SAM-dependent methyltransferase [bacterium]MBU1917890.1 class I SAM-dependent methyltransferase [bacterium]